MYGSVSCITMTIFPVPVGLLVGAHRPGAIALGGLGRRVNTKKENRSPQGTFLGSAGHDQPSRVVDRERRATCASHLRSRFWRLL